MTVTLRAAGGELVTWDPVTLRRGVLPREGDGYRLDLAALGSVFVVPGGPADAPPTTPVGEVAVENWRLSLPGVVDTGLDGPPRPWTQLGRGPAGFARVGTYSADVDVEPSLAGARQVEVELADVGDLAQVRVNGTACGVVWTAPWRVDVTAAVRPGRNTVEVDVANAWMNRLIAEAAEPTGEIFGPVASVYAPDAPVHLAGLTGPVVLRAYR